MRLVLKKYNDGTLRPRWFGVYEARGKTKVVTLDRWRGSPPGSLSVSDTGDTIFEASRQKAYATLEETCKGQKSEADKEVLVQKIHAIRYGSEVKFTLLKDLPDKWDDLPHPKGKPGEHERNTCRNILQRFVEFVQAANSKLSEAGEVSRDIVKQFMEAEDKRGVSNRTWNKTLVVLKSIFKTFEPYSDAWQNYLATQAARPDNTINHKPFMPDEIKAILQAAESDPEMRPLIVTALSTALRRGDICCLKWAAINWQEQKIKVKAAKTKKSTKQKEVNIPIFPQLLNELKQLRGKSSCKPTDYVFPFAAELYKRGPDSLDRRLKTILRAAGFIDEETAERLKTLEKQQSKLDSLPVDKLQAKGLKAIQTADITEKRRERMADIFKRYLAGQSMKQIARETGASVGIVSMRLSDVEQWTGAAIVRREAIPEIIRGATMAEHSEDTPRLRRASLYSWHSFRTTWITLALSAGVPLEIVKRVTGHQTSQIVLDNYFNPEDQQFRQTLLNTMPRELTSGQTDDPRKEALNLARRLSARTLQKDKARLVELLAKM